MNYDCKASNQLGDKSNETPAPQPHSGDGREPLEALSWYPKAELSGVPGFGGLNHARSSNKLCPNYKNRKRLEDKPEGAKETMVTVTIGLNTVLEDPRLSPVILDSVHRCTDMYNEASRVLNGYLIWLMEADIDVPEVTLSFMRQFFLVVKASSGNPRQHHASRDASINGYVDTVDANHRPPSLAWTDGRGLGQLTTNMAQAYLVNCQNHLVINFESKLRIWLKYKLRLHVGLLLNFNPDFLGKILQYVMVYLLPRVNQNVLDFPHVVRDALVSPHHGYLLFRGVNLVLEKAKRLLTTRAGGNLSLDAEEIKRSWHEYFRPFWRILRTFVKHSESNALERRISRRRSRGLRLFSLAPIASHKAHYISIDTDALHDLLRNVNGVAAQVPSKALFRPNAMQWWLRMFNLNKVTTVNRRFAMSIETDGVGVSIHLLKPKVDSAVNEYGFTFTNPSVYVPLNIGPSRVVALDPGRRDLYVGVFREHTNGNDQIWEAGDPDEHVIRCSNARWQEISGTKYASLKGATWLKGNASVSTLLRNLPTPRCCSSAAYSLHLTLFLANRDELLGYYREMKWRRLRWKTRIKRQKAYDTVCREIGNDELDAVIIYGNGSFSSTSRGHASAPNKQLFVELRRRYRNARLVSEYLTSQVCLKCEGRLTDTRHWGLKKCNKICLTLWNRDVNDARNIRHMFLYRNSHNAAYPEAFLRG